jgi:hypothetical protein
MALWLFAGFGLTAAVLILGAYRLSARRAPHRDEDPGICFYLHEKHVMNLYQQSNDEALTQEIQETIRSGRQTGLNAQVGSIKGRAEREAGMEKVSKYSRESVPISILGRVVDKLEEKGNIVHVNLRDSSLEPGAALDRALWSDRRADTARLSDLSSFVFVSVTGEFRVTDKTAEKFVLSAPYGTGEPSQVSVTCVRDHLLGVEPAAGPFSARCLGRIQGWDPTTRTLVIDPVLAIYR